MLRILLISAGVWTLTGMVVALALGKMAGKAAPKPESAPEGVQVAVDPQRERLERQAHADEREAN
jgi:hypothetical protein